MSPGSGHPLRFVRSVTPGPRCGVGRAMAGPPAYLRRSRRKRGSELAPSTLQSISSTSFR